MEKMNTQAGEFGLSYLLNGIEAEVVCGSMETKVNAPVFDTRKVNKGCLFICMKGSRFDSHQSIESIVQNGAAAIIIDRDVEISRTVSEAATVIRVRNSRAALAGISAAYFGNPAKKLVTIGVTGTKGKTTTTHMIKLILEKAGHKVGVIGTNGISIGGEYIATVNTTPESYELHRTFAMMLEKGCTHMVMEVSSQGIKLDRTAGIVFDYAVFTNISPDHIGEDEHADFDEYLMYKSRLFSQCRHALVNADDGHAEYIIKNAGCGDIKTFGENRADIAFSNIGYKSENGFMGIEMDICGLRASIGIPGHFNAYNAAAAIGICKMLGVDADILKNGLRDIHVNGRMELAYASERLNVIIDYAHNAVSMESLLNTLRAYNPQRLVVVFGCGGNRAKDRRYSMGEIAGKLADYSIVTADNSRFEKPEDIIDDIVSRLEPAGGKYIRIPDRREAIFEAIKGSEYGDTVAVIGKGHEDYQEINGVRTHFLDREVVDEAIADMKKEGRL